MRVLDLFSGIGGFSLGMEGAGAKTVAFCEKNPKCWYVLHKHWPHIPIFADINYLLGVDLGRVDVITGGFPCQPFSTASAGKRKGTDDDRYLWPTMLQVIKEQRPTWVIGENVAGIEGMAFSQVVSDLEDEGFQVQPLDIPACALGQDHRRPRYWFLAHSDSNREYGRTVNAETCVLPRDYYDSGKLGTPHGIPTELDRMKMLGNSVHVGIVAEIGRNIVAIEKQYH